MNRAPPHGWLAEYGSAARLRNAVAGLRDAGYTRLEAFSPIPVDGLADALRPGEGQRFNPVALAALAGGTAGGVGVLALQWYAATVAYPMNIGGRPNASWPAFIPAALEMTFLFAAVCGVLAMLAGAGLPRLYHAVFNIDRFAAASRDGFFVLVRADDPLCDGHSLPVRELLARTGAVAIEEVPE